MSGRQAAEAEAGGVGGVGGVVAEGAARMPPELAGGSRTHPVLSVDASVARRDFTVTTRFELRPAERLALFGPSGAGKTSILELVAGLAPLRHGSVVVDGRVIAEAGRGRRPRLEPGRHRRVALVRQPTTLFWHLSVGDNLAYGTSGDNRDVRALAESLGLAGLERAAPLTLSGGQRQRVALGRALAVPHAVLLLDEPFSAIDVAARGPLRDLAVDRTEATGACAILVTHDLDEAQAFGSRLGIVDAGSIVHLGHPSDVVLRPASVRAAELVGYRSFVRAGASGAWFALHPDRFVPGSNPDRGVVLAGVVRSVGLRGARYELSLELDDRTAVVAHVDQPPTIGERLSLTAIDPPSLPAPPDGTAPLGCATGALVAG